MTEQERRWFERGARRAEDSHRMGEIWGDACEELDVTDAFEDLTENEGLHPSDEERAKAAIRLGWREYRKAVPPLA